jgi:hypothetical protein
MHHEEIELNFETSCQQILALESEILWEARSTPTLVDFSFFVASHFLRPVIFSLLIKII